jgi:sugar/nucleoside kinase (ribokinase family)
MSGFDLLFIGHTYRDGVRPFRREPIRTVGGALIYGAMAAARAGAKVAAVTKLAEPDRGLLAPLEEAGVHCIVLPAPVTSEFEVVYLAEDMERREIYQRACAGAFEPAEVPSLGARWTHLAGNARGEFPLDLVRHLKARARPLSLDLQGFIRQVDPDTRRIAVRDFPEKRDLVSLADAVKLDAAEAEILTGEADPDRAIRHVASWGCPEVVLTRTEGVLGRFGTRTAFAKFTNSSALGRNGRGDTTFAAYLAWRLTHSPEESLLFAAALASIKLETPGPFAGTLQEVLARLEA